jgi:trimeric autotransporter adhesin
MLVLLASVFTGRAAPGDEHWDDRFTNAVLRAGVVSKLVWENGQLYVIGSFHKAGAVWATNIAKWNGTNWSAFGAGLSGEVIDLVAKGSNVYASGFGILPELGSSFGLARWNGETWEALETSLNSISAMLALEQGLVVAGRGTNANRISGAAIERIVENTTERIGSGHEGNFRSLALYKGRIYVAGAFTSIDGVSVTNVAAWNGSSWASVGRGIGRAGETPNLMLAADDRWLYVAGEFKNVGQRAITNIARWDGTNWHEMPGLEFDRTSRISSLSVRKGTVYVAGHFGPNQPKPGYNFARWRTNEGWTIIPAGPHIVHIRPMLAATERGVFAGSDFSRLLNTRVDGVGFWNGRNWRSVGGGVAKKGYVTALAARDGSIIVGGNFNSIGGITAYNLARWDGTNWFPFGPGTDGPVNALASAKNVFYVAGDFRRIGNLPTPGVVRFKGTNWTSLGTTLNVLPSELGVYGTNLFVGGVTKPDSGYSDFGIYRWDGIRWRLIASGENNWEVDRVSAFFEMGFGFYAAGRFRDNRSGGGWTYPSTHTYFLRLAGAPWPPNLYASGMIEGVTVNNGVLYAAAAFVAGIRNNLIIWYGSNAAHTIAFEFSPHFGIAGPIASIRDNIFVANQAGDGLLKWDGVDWHTLGSGVRGGVSALLAVGTNLVVGGRIDRAGGKPSYGIAIWHDPPTADKLRIKRDTPEPLVYRPLPITNAHTLVYWPSRMTNYVLETTSDLNSRSWEAVQQRPSLFGSHYVVTNTAGLFGPSQPGSSPTRQFFRLRLRP